MATASETRVLIVDDEPLLADTLAIIFRRAGYNSIAVYSGEEALSVIAEQKPSVVITDVVMPGLDGIALATKIRTFYPNCRVLLFSGNAETQNLLEAAQLDGHSFEVLAKPVPPPQLLARVASMLDQHSCFN